MEPNGAHRPEQAQQSHEKGVIGMRMMTVTSPAAAPCTFLYTSENLHLYGLLLLKKNQDKKNILVIGLRLQHSLVHPVARK